MTKIKRTYLIAFAIAILSWTDISIAKERIVAHVGGVSCPFCAFGLEKKLKAIPGAEKVTINVSQGTATIDVAEGGKISQEQVEKAIKDAGFTPEKVEIHGNHETEEKPESKEKGKEEGS